MAKFRTKDYLTFYNDLTTGGIISTYDTRWYAFFAKGIAFFTKEDAEERLNISHSILICNVVEMEDRKKVYTSEQSVAGGEQQKVYIFYMDKRSSFHKRNKKIYYSKPTKNMLKQQEKITALQDLVDIDATKPDDYDFTTIIAFLYRRFIRKFGKYLGVQPKDANADKYNGICSGYIWSLLFDAGFVSKEVFDEHNIPSPAELTKITTKLNLTEKIYRVELD